MKETYPTPPEVSAAECCVRISGVNGALAGHSNEPSKGKQPPPGPESVNKSSSDSYAARQHLSADCCPAKGTLRQTVVD